MVFSGGLLLLMLCGAGFATEYHDFNLKSSEHKSFKYPVKELYKFFGTGPHPSLCANLTTQGPVNISVGGCNNFVTIGSYSSSQAVQITRLLVEKSMGYDTDRHCESDVEIRFQSTKAVVGSMNLFNCLCVTVQHPTFEIGNMDYIETTQCHPSVETWQDRMRTLRFRLNNGEVDRRELGLNQAIDAAIVNHMKTVCFEYQGDGFVKLTLSKCVGTQNITMLLNTDVLYGFGTTDKDTLKAMAEATCSNDWFIDIQSTSRRSVTGAIEIYGCDREIGNSENIPFTTLSADTDLMKTSKTFYINLKPNSEAMYSADLANMFDMAVNDPKKLSEIRLEVDSTAPVSITLTKCKYGENPVEVKVAGNMYTGYTMINREEIKLLQSLVVMENCGPNEADDGLYLIVETSRFMAIGSISFTLQSEEKKVDPFVSSVTYSLGSNYSISRLINLETMVDEAIMNKSIIGYNLQTTKEISVFISKCKESKRQLIGGSTSSGLFVMARHVVQGIAKLMNHKCSIQENVEEGFGYVHIESPYGPAEGVLQFVRTKNADKNKHIDYIPFDKLPAEQFASEENQESGIVLSISKKPTEINLKYFAYSALTKHHLNIVVETEKPITLRFSKCQNGSNRRFSINIMKTRALLLNEIMEIYKLSKAAALCDTKSKYGIFVRVQGSSGNVTIKMNNFRELIVGNGKEYSVSKKATHTIAIPVGDFVLPISVHVYNNETEPVLLFASMCSPHHPPLVFWNQKMTMANIKLNMTSFKQITALAGDCETGKKDTLYFSIRSNFARGKINIDKAHNVFCDGYSCGEGTIEYIKNTNGWVIAQ